MDPETGRISLFWELIAGGAAGGSQVVSFRLFTSLRQIQLISFDINATTDRHQSFGNYQNPSAIDGRDGQA
jgi:hypothetical protein